MVASDTRPMHQLTPRKHIPWRKEPKPFAVPLRGLVGRRQAVCTHHRLDHNSPSRLDRLLQLCVVPNFRILAVGCLVLKESQLSSIENGA